MEADDRYMVYTNFKLQSSLLKIGIDRPAYLPHKARKLLGV